MMFTAHRLAADAMIKTGSSCAENKSQGMLKIPEAMYLQVLLQVLVTDGVNEVVDHEHTRLEGRLEAVVCVQPCAM